MLFSVHNRSDSSLIASTGAHDQASGFERNALGDLVVLQVEPDGVVDLDDRIRVTDGTTIVGDKVRDALGSELDTLYFAKLVAGLLSTDSVDGESTLDIIQNTEVFSRFFNRDNV